MANQPAHKIRAAEVDFSSHNIMGKSISDSRMELLSIIRRISARGWCPATAGNFSILLDRDPIRMLITPSGVDKNLLDEKDLLEVNEKVEILNGSGNPTAEGLIHSAVYQTREARSVLHIHTVANTILSERHLNDGFIDISGYEILKGLPGVTTHQHTERIPVFPNSQNMEKLSADIKKKLQKDKNIKALLLAGHGIHTWGASPQAAFQHLEALEFLLEVQLRKG